MHSKWKGKPNQRRTAGTVYAAAAKKNIDRSKRLSQEEEMGVISELIRSEADGTISFGDYTLDAKAKLDNFEHQGDLYDLITDSLLWLDNASGHFSNFNITFLIRLICQLGFHPNTDNPSSYPFFDLQNAEFTPTRPSHNYYLCPNDAQYIPLFMSLNYSNMHLLKTTHQQRFRALKIITTYYKLHITGFPDIKSLDIVNELLKPKTVIRS